VVEVLSIANLLNYAVLDGTGVVLAHEVPEGSLRELQELLGGSAFKELDNVLVSVNYFLVAVGKVANKTPGNRFAVELYAVFIRIRTRLAHGTSLV
jgi:hypothetical protein